MIRFPKRYTNFALALVLIFLTAIAIFTLTSKPRSSLTLKASQNKFQASFQLSKYDRYLAESFLQNANIPQNILNGIEFTLDGTSSAKLAYLSPIVTNLIFEKNRVDFKRSTETSLNLNTYSNDLEFSYPDATTVILFGQNLLPYIKKSTNLPEDFKTWMDENLKNTKGQYLILFGDKPDFALAFSKELSPDFGKLKSLKVAAESYKEETQDNVTFHLLKITNTQNEENYIFFESGDLVYITSSLESAKELEQLQKSPQNNIFNVKTPVSFALFIKNSPDHKADKALKFLVGNQQQLTKYVEKVKTATFYLNGKEFSGSVELLPS